MDLEIIEVAYILHSNMSYSPHVNLSLEKLHILSSSVVFQNKSSIKVLMPEDIK